MKTPILLKTITVAGALAATLTLSACDMHISFGQDDTRQDEASADPGEAEAEPTEETVAEESAPGSGTAGTSTSSGTSTSAGTDTDSSGSTSTADSDSGASGSSASDSGASGSGSSGEGTGSEGVDLDDQGNGTIPAADLEVDIKNAYADKGVYVDLVECRYDLRIIAKRGSTNCEVTDSGKTHYGTVKVTSVTSAGVGYQLEFPNIS
ncbi:MAG: hypothetical protein ACTIC1_08785 [Brevibacterium sp.]